MPLIGTGDQGFKTELMADTILRTSIAWIERGLQVRVLKIVVRTDQAANIAKIAFAEFRRSYETRQASLQNSLPVGQDPGPDSHEKYDLFLSYCRKDSEAADFIVKKINSTCPGARIFYDQETLQAGASWLVQVADSLDTSRHVVALYTPEYWASAPCKDEFAAALARQNDTGRRILFPIYIRTAAIPYLFRNLQYVDCRENDTNKLEGACRDLGACLSG